MTRRRMSTEAATWCARRAIDFLRGLRPRSPAAAAELARFTGVAAVSADNFTIVGQPDMFVTEATDVTVASGDMPETAFLYARQWNLRQVEADAGVCAGRCVIS